jgi:hypothetical protein
MRGRDYVIFAVLSCLLFGLSVVLWPVNFVTALLIAAGEVPWELRGQLSPASGWNGLGPMMLVSLLWPLTLAPLHWAAYRRLRRGAWGFVGLFVLVNVLLAFVVLVLCDNS